MMHRLPLLPVQASGGTTRYLSRCHEVHASLVPGCTLLQRRHCFQGRTFRCSASYTQRKLAIAAAPLERIVQLFSPTDDSKRELKTARKELLEIIRAGSSDRARVGKLVDVLAGSGLPFKEDYLGGGKWQVVYTRGALLWQQATTLGSLTSPQQLRASKNKAFQEFDPQGRTAYNEGQIFGDKIYATAEGTYEPYDEAVAMPKTIRANIARGTLHFLGKKVPLPIRGSGYFEVCYLDDALRVFRGRGGSLVMQVRADFLDKLLAT